MGDVVALVPHVVDDVVAADDAAGVEKEEFKQEKFFFGKFDGFVFKMQSAGHAVQRNLANLQVFVGRGLLNNFANEEGNLAERNGGI